MKLVKTQCAKRIINSQNPIETYDNIINLIDEVKDYKKISSTTSFLIKYISRFEDINDNNEKSRFVNYIENITTEVPERFVIDNWDYFYNNFSNLPEGELLEHKNLLENFSASFINSYFTKN
ncbi:MAG: hypothetical protein QG594_2348, partial [Bacteroidota bacterium]|nr:hypothetical protein [Bacteroidota bacterium]